MNLNVTDSMLDDLKSDVVSSDSSSVNNESMTYEEAVKAKQNVYEGTFGAEIEGEEQCWLKADELSDPSNSQSREEEKVNILPEERKKQVCQVIFSSKDSNSRAMN